MATSLWGSLTVINDYLAEAFRTSLSNCQLLWLWVLPCGVGLVTCSKLSGSLTRAHAQKWVRRTQVRRAQCHDDSSADTRTNKSLDQLLSCPQSHCNFPSFSLNPIVCASAFLFLVDLAQCACVYMHKKVFSMHCNNVCKSSNWQAIISLFPLKVDLGTWIVWWRWI